MAATASTSYAASHYPIDVFGRKVHILNACATYAHIFQEIVTKSSLSDLAAFMDRAAPSNAAGAKVENNNDSKDQQQQQQHQVKSYFDLLAPSITTTTQHIPHGQMKRISLFRYIHPNGVKVMSAEAVAATLRAAKMPFITDLISHAVEKKPSNQKNNNSNNNNKTPSSSPTTTTTTSTEGDEEVAMFEQLREMNFHELDIARFCLCALWELSERNVFDPKNEFELTPLAKRDLKKALSTAAGGGKDGNKDDDGGGAATATANGTAGATSGNNTGSAVAASKAIVGTGTARGPQTQKNLRALLEEECAVAWPHTPMDKAVIFTIVNDPNQPRHKPLFKASIEFPLLKKMKVEGEWAPTKRDAENSAADKSLSTVRRLLKK